MDEIKKYMPKYSAEMEKLDPNIWQYGLYNGKNWGVPKVFLEGATGLLPAYNSNWLKKVGYTEPPKTLEQLEDVLTKFAKNDPDGNGKNDTYGMTARGKDQPPQVFNSVLRHLEQMLTCLLNNLMEHLLTASQQNLVDKR